MSLTDSAHLGLNDARQYTSLIKKEAARRKVMAVCNATVERARAGDDPDDILHDLQGTAIAIQTASAHVRPVPISQYVGPTWDSMVEQMTQATQATLGIPTGIEPLDHVLSGWQPGELTYVGAMPGRGKTSFMLQCMHQAATRGVGVGCISLEMRAQQLVRRLATMHSGLPAYAFRDPRKLRLAERDFAREFVYKIGELPIQICDQSGLTPGAISSLARQMHANGAKVVFVDFVQIIHEDGRERREAINRISAALRDTSKALEMPLVVASQLSRRQNDTDTAPTMRDLKESGNLEQDAHNVLLIHRPQLRGEWTGDDQIIVAKQREGVTGHISVTYDERSLTFKAREKLDAA